MNADEARCVGEMTGVRVRKYKGIEHFDPRLFLEAPLTRKLAFKGLCIEVVNITMSGKYESLLGQAFEHFRRIAHDGISQSSKETGIIWLRPIRAFLNSVNATLA